MGSVAKTLASPSRHKVCRPVHAATGAAVLLSLIAARLERRILEKPSDATPDFYPVDICFKPAEACRR